MNAEQQRVVTREEGRLATTPGSGRPMTHDSNERPVVAAPAR
jgi:hypothetical protein